MFWFLFAVFLGLPLAGLVTLPDTPTTASAMLAYLAHLAVIAVAAVVTMLVVRRRHPELATMGPPAVEPYQYRRIARRTLYAQLAIFAYLLVGLGSIAVVTGNVGRGEFRSSLGGTGFVLAFVVKSFSPALLGLASLSYRFLTRVRASDRLLLAANFLVVMAAGASLGYKSSIVRFVLPGLLALLWNRLTVRKVVVVSLASFALMAGAGAYFSQRSVTDAIDYNVHRATTVTVRSAKEFWDDHREGIGPVDYSKTLLNGLGDQNVTILTGVPSGTEEYVQFNLAQRMTLIEFPEETELALSGQFNVTGTVWGEGVLALGVPGFLAFSVLAGVSATLLYHLFTVAVRRGDHAVAATVATFFAVPYLGWINSGVLSSVLHVVTITGVVLTLFVCRSALGRRPRQDPMGRPKPSGWLLAGPGAVPPG